MRKNILTIILLFTFSVINISAISQESNPLYKNSGEKQKSSNNLYKNKKNTVAKDKIFTVNGVTFSMKPVEGGTFTMGATAKQGSDAYYNEKDTHLVTLSSYYIGKYEVTQALWQAVTGNNPSKFKGDNLPVEYVSWNDCQAFITELNRITGKTFRLPTEAEWEYASRGGRKSHGYKYSGSDVLENVAWYVDNCGRRTHPVGTKFPNELGIYDMSGNVWEWCYDWNGPYSSNSKTNPTGPSNGHDRVNRGGSWDDFSRLCRVSTRYNNTPDDRHFNLGLRLVLDVNGTGVFNNEQITTIPEVTIQTLNHEHGVTVNGKKGMKLHYHVVINNHYKDKINFSVFFYMGNGNKLYGTYSGYTAKDNQVCAFTDATANYSDSEWKDLWFFIPYDAIGSGLTSGNYTIAAQLDVRDIKDGYRTMASSNRETFNFSYTKPIQNYQQQQNMYGYVPPTNPYNIYNPYMNYSVPSGEQLMNMSLNHINSTEVQINKMVKQYKEDRRKATGRYPSSAEIENYKQMLRNQDVANMQAVTNMINDNLETKKQTKKTSTTNRQSSRITCPECNGIGFETTAHKYAMSTSSVLGYLQPYKNKVGNKCPYCKSTAEHYHYPCEKCKGHGKIKNPNF